MSERLTSEQLADVARRIESGVCHLCGNGVARFGCPACDGTGAFALSVDTAKEIVAELRALRLSDAEREALRWALDVMHNTDGINEDRRGIRDTALSVLRRLVEGK